MRIIGYYSLFLALLLSFSGIILSLMVIKKDLKALKESLLRIVNSVFILNLISLFVLEIGFITDDFSIKYVYEYSERAEELIYKISALWAGMEGSLLLWEFLLSLYTLILIKFNKNILFEAKKFSLFILFIINFFFLCLLFFKNNPFLPLKYEGIPVSPESLKIIDGTGLNPLLKNFYMIVHPPLLYFGYVGLTIPFVLIVSLTLIGRDFLEDIQEIEKWVIFSWLTLAMGTIFGAYWAYLELGWGGYWSWDPVENSSLIPLIFLTATVHAIILLKRLNVLRRFLFILISFSFFSSIFGTYLTRSGVLESVHSFGGEGGDLPAFFKTENLFLLFLFFILVAVFITFFKGFGLLSSKGHFEKIFSKDTFNLFGVIILTIFGFIVFYGLFYQVFSKLVMGIKVAVSTEFYIEKTKPLFPLILFFIVLYQIFELEKRGKRTIYLCISLLISVIVSLSFIKSFEIGLFDKLLEEKRNILYFFLILILSFLVIICSLLNVLFSLSYKSFSLRKLFISLAHSGLALIFIGVLFSSTLNISYDLYLREKEEKFIGDFKVSLNELGKSIKTTMVEIYADLILNNKNNTIRLKPMRVFYKSTLESGKEPTFEVDIKRIGFVDYYVVLSEYDLDEKKAKIVIYLNPCVNLIWWGSFFVIFSFLFSLVWRFKSV